MISFSDSEWGCLVACFLIGLLSVPIWIYLVVKWLWEHVSIT